MGPVLFPEENQLGLLRKGVQVPSAGFSSL